MSVSEAYNYRQVSDQLHTSGLLSEEQLQQLGGEGFSRVINLLPSHHDYAVKDEQALVEAQGIDYCYIPVEFDDPNDDNFAAFCAAMDSAGNDKLLVHCAANYRVSGFYAMYAHQSLGWTAEQARDFIAAIWNPAEYPEWDTFINGKLK